MDKTTFKKVQKRDEGAFLDMIQTYKSVIYYTALAYFKNNEKALEAVQEVTFRAYKSIHKVKESTAIRGWLTRITINYCLSELKKNKRYDLANRSLDTFSDNSSDFDTSLFITEAIQSLKKNYQTVVMMKYQQDLTITEIAESLNIPVGTVKTHLNRALKDLRAFMKKGAVDQND